MAVDVSGWHHSMVPSIQWQAALYSLRSLCFLWSSQLGSCCQNLHFKTNEMALTNGKAHHLFWTGIPTQQVHYASRVPVKMATWTQPFFHAAPCHRCRAWDTHWADARSTITPWIGLYGPSTKDAVHRQGICLVYPSQVVLAQTRERVSTQWARPLVIFATELKAFKWETEVP